MALPCVSPVLRRVGARADGARRRPLTNVMNPAAYDAVIAAMSLYPRLGGRMLHYAVVFFVIAIIAALLGFGGIAAGAAGIARILFVVFLVLALVTFLVDLL